MEGHGKLQADIERAQTLLNMADALQDVSSILFLLWFKVFNSLYNEEIKKLNLEACPLMDQISVDDIIISFGIQLQSFYYVWILHLVLWV